MTRTQGAHFAIGIGARRGVDAHELVDLVLRTARTAGVEPEDCFLFSIENKNTEPGMHEAARMLGTEIVFLPSDALLARKDDVLTRSPRIEALTGVGSVAEAAALVGAGPGSRLLAPRVATNRLTCAIARACANSTSETR